MALKKQKYYVVWNGHEPGIYSSWPACQLQIKGYPGAKYKSFISMEEAKKAFEDDYNRSIVPKGKKKAVNIASKNEIRWDSLSVDAACSGSTGKMEYRGVWTKDGVQLFHQGPFALGTNNVGEFLALVHGLAYLKKMKLEKTPIYSDSRTAISWVKNKRIKTTLKKTLSNKILFELMDRALHWLENNEFNNRILKWKTSEWGEIPADFGRK